MTWRVIVGTVTVVLTMILFGYVAVTETDRMASFTNAYDSRQIENGAALFENNCQICHGLEGQGVLAKGPALNVPELFNGTRTREAGWAGTIDNFVRLTIAAGRPRPSAHFADQNFQDPMPTWGEEYGGPLRKDQIDALTIFVMNWGPAYANVTPEPTQPIDAVGTDISVELPAGDAAKGADLARAGPACTACHVDSPTGPAWLASADPNGEGIGTRAAHRFSDPGYTGAATSAEQYLFESIVQPNAHVGEGFQPNIMPQDYGAKLTEQDVADLIAYLLTLE
ncbi:MAG: c-type cytochrome [Anaerolineales bacterium]